MFRSYLLILFFLLSVSCCHSFEFDMEDPLVVAKSAFEYGLMFRYSDLKVISSPNVFSYIDKAANQAIQAVELFKRNGIDFYKEVHYDFTNMDYELDYDENNKARVSLTGSYTIYVTQKYEKKEELNRYIYLVKDDGFYYFCGSDEIK